MSSWRGRRWGIGQGLDIILIIAVKFPISGQKCEVIITEIPHLGYDLWSQVRTKIQISLPPGQQDNSNAYPRAKAIDQIPALCPASGLTLIGAFINI